MATFYSKQTGNWEDGANWASVSHTGTAGASPGVKGTDWPGSGDTAIISAGHTITVTTDLSGEASAILLQCDAPGTNNGTLKFSPTANTGLKARLSTVNSSSTFNVYLGERLAPIQRGKTCTLNSGGGNFKISSGNLVFQAWGQHREANTSDIYCDLLSVAASRGNTSVTLSGDISPGLQANDWLFFTEHTTTSTAVAAAELVQVDSYNSGTRVAVLKTPLKYDYTTTNAYVFKVKDHIVNTLLASDHTSGADYVLQEDLYPNGTAGGSFLVCRSNTSAKSGTEYPTVSSYNSGTKTLTATASSSTSQSKGSIVLMDDFNVKIVGSATGRIGGDTTYNNAKQIMAYTQFDTWQSINCGAESMILVNCNLFNCKSFNSDTLTGYKMLMFGVGCGQKSAGASEARVMLQGTKGGQVIRCLMAQSFDSGSNGYGPLQNWYFQDSVLMPCAFTNVRNNYFKNCGIGNQTQTGQTNMSTVHSNVFDTCYFFGSSVVNADLFELTTGYINIFNNCVFGETSNGKVLTNSRNFRVRGCPLTLLLNGARFASGEPDPAFAITASQNIHAALVRVAMNNITTNQFANFTPGGNVKQDTSGYRSSSPSVKFTHSAATHPVWFDIPMFLNTGSKTITIYTNPSTGAWSDAPQILLLPEYAADIVARDWTTLPYIARAEQSTLTTSVYSQLQLTTTIGTAGIYILRLWARNASGTLNWDDFSVA